MLRAEKAQTKVRKTTKTTGQECCEMTVLLVIRKTHQISANDSSGKELVIHGATQKFSLVTSWSYKTE
jgi:hypothetical protein